MRTMKASEFKAKCLQVLDEVRATGEPVQITKRGAVVAELRSLEAQPGEESPLATFQKLFPQSLKTDGDSGLDPSLSIWDEAGGFDAHMKRKFGYLWSGGRDAAE
jgi:prevent-host-death family protein